MNNNLYGIVLSLLVGLVGLFLSKFIPIGAVALSIIVGIIVGNTLYIGQRFTQGITFCEKTLLSWAIAFMGINLDFGILTTLGVKSIFLIILAMAVTIVSALIIGKIFKLDTKFSLILGIGNAVCGSSAIAATKDIVGLDKQKVGLSIAIVNFLGTIGIFLVPFIGIYVCKFTDINNGILIGNTLQAVGQVLASGFSISNSAGQTATIVKMGRILMLTPLIFILIYSMKNRDKQDGQNIAKSTIPLFIIGFIIFSILATIHILPDMIVDIIKHLSHYCLIIAMAAIGLKINFKTIVQHGSKALIIGILIFAVQIIFSSVVIINLF